MLPFRAYVLPLLLLFFSCCLTFASEATVCMLSLTDGSESLLVSHRLCLQLNSLRAKQTGELTANGTAVSSLPTGRTELEVSEFVSIIICII